MLRAVSRARERPECCVASASASAARPLRAARGEGGGRAVRLLLISPRNARPRGARSVVRRANAPLFLVRSRRAAFVVGTASVAGQVREDAAERRFDVHSSSRADRRGAWCLAQQLKSAGAQVLRRARTGTSRNDHHSPGSRCQRTSARAPLSAEVWPHGPGVRARRRAPGSSASSSAQNQVRLSRTPRARHTPCTPTRLRSRGVVLLGFWLSKEPARIFLAPRPPKKQFGDCTFRRNHQ